MKEPTILITAELWQLGTPYRLSHIVPIGYVEAIERAGGSPLVFPVLASASKVRRYLELANGVLLIGGRDYRFGCGQSKRKHVNLRRERHDRAVISALMQHDVAVLGICLGMQLINLGRGGTLYGDIGHQIPGSLDHERHDHDVTLDPDSRLGGLLGEKIKVNSSHHQAIGDLGLGLRAVGWAPDRIIEALEDGSDRFVVGVQWHPERMLDDEQQNRLWRSFVSAAGAGGTWS